MANMAKKKQGGGRTPALFFASNVQPYNFKIGLRQRRPHPQAMADKLVDAARASYYKPLNV